MPKETDKIVEPINATFDEVAEKVIQPAPLKQLSTNALQNKNQSEPAPRESQSFLDLGIEMERDINGIEMGVLENGIAFLSERGVARVSGVARSVIFDIRNDWEKSFYDDVLGKDRISFLKEYLFKNGYKEPKLYLEIRKDNSVHYAYPDIVCMAILEYYAFEAQGKNQTAVENYRKFARYGLQNFIYECLGYHRGDIWKYHNDRVSLLKDASPSGYFIVFKETAGLVVDLINAGVTVNDKTIPDGSVGSCWANYWKDNDLGSKYGERIKYKHSYPDYYPQSASNPQPANAYPETSLPEFRRWFREQYLTTKYPAYILTKANIIKGGKEEALRIAAMYDKKQIS